MFPCGTDLANGTSVLRWAAVWIIILLLGFGKRNGICWIVGVSICLISTWFFDEIINDILFYIDGERQTPNVGSTVLYAFPLAIALVILVSPYIFLVRQFFGNRFIVPALQYFFLLSIDFSYTALLVPKSIPLSSVFRLLVDFRFYCIPALVLVSFYLYAKRTIPSNTTILKRAKPLAILLSIPIGQLVLLVCSGVLCSVFADGIFYACVVGLQLALLVCVFHAAILLVPYCIWNIFNVGLLERFRAIYS